MTTLEFTLRLVAALFSGMLIGFERQYAPEISALDGHNEG